MLRGTDWLPVALNRAADTSASSGTSFTGSDIRGPTCTSAVIERAAVVVIVIVVSPSGVSA
ncbi:hypothetical protein GCM10010315_54710 [Streptomyces luteosporeus]|uniref:Uncharacterized protein n=1 Tax=Streptomyces luteosporeus TaxID=173856 RepID=A0ABP6GM83_9ACTN